MRSARRIVFDLAANSASRLLLATVPPRHLNEAAWRIARATRLLTWHRGAGIGPVVTGMFYLELLRRLTAGGARFDLPHTEPDVLLDLWRRHRAVVLVGPHTPVLAVPLVRAIHDAGRELVGIVGQGDPLRPVLGTDRVCRHIEAGPRSLVAARRALRQGKALIVLIDRPSGEADLKADRLTHIDGRAFHIYANIFRLAMRVGVPIVFHCASVQNDGKAVFALEAAQCEVPRCEVDVQSCLDDYVHFLRGRVAAGWI